MNKYITFLSKIVIVLGLLLPIAAHASVREDYEESHIMYLATTACMAAYSDRVAGFAIETLHRDGWQVESYSKTSSKADARFLLARKIQPDNNEPVYILAVVGTETFKDLITDLLVRKVYFAGRTPEEFAANAARKNIPDSAPKVHQGYNQFVQTALAAEGHYNQDITKQQLATMLLEHHSGKLYLVGHSMGGATATLAGARLVNMGIQPEQIQIITFGAPAVGNEAFRKEFEPLLHLTRVVTAGDPITEILQKLVGGYKQFGQEIHWAVPEDATVMPHEMTTYLDIATKHYYWNRHLAIQVGAIPALINQTVSAQGMSNIYIAPIQNDLSKPLQSEFFYMKEALQDEFRRTFPDYSIDTASKAEDVFKKAAAAGCQQVLITKIQDHKIKNKETGYYITLEQSVYDVATGDIISNASYGRSTRTTTPLQALIHDGTNSSRDSHEWMASAKATPPEIKHKNVLKLTS